MARLKTNNNKLNRDARIDNYNIHEQFIRILYLERILIIFPSVGNYERERERGWLTDDIR